MLKFLCSQKSVNWFRTDQWVQFSVWIQSSTACENIGISQSSQRGRQQQHRLRYYTGNVTNARARLVLNVSNSSEEMLAMTSVISLLICLASHTLFFSFSLVRWERQKREYWMGLGLVQSARKPPTKVRASIHLWTQALNLVSHQLQLLCFSSATIKTKKHALV